MGVPGRCGWDAAGPYVSRSPLCLQSCMLCPPPFLLLRRKAGACVPQVFKVQPAAVIANSFSRTHTSSWLLLLCWFHIFTSHRYVQMKAMCIWNEHEHGTAFLLYSVGFLGGFFFFISFFFFLWYAAKLFIVCWVLIS